MDGNNDHEAGSHAQVNIHEESELRYWAEKFGVGREQLVEAVEQAGQSANLVKMELKKAERRGG